MFRSRRRDWIILTAFIVAGAVGYGIYSVRKWTEDRLRRTEADMKSNLPLRVDQNNTLVDVKYGRTHSTYWCVVDKADQFDPQETSATGPDWSLCKRRQFEHDEKGRLQLRIPLQDQGRAYFN